MIHLDNHISKAKWCCDSGDGNSWFGDREFDAEKWRRAWGYMANYVSPCKRVCSLDAHSSRARQDPGQRLPALERAMNFEVQTEMYRSRQRLTTGATGEPP